MSLWPGLVKNKTGFTLIELMLVVAILSILAAVAYPKASNAIRATMDASTKGNLAVFRAAQAAYIADTEGARLQSLYHLRYRYLGDRLPKVFSWYHGVDNTAGTGTWAEAAVARNSWWLVNDPTDIRDQTIIVSCSHTDLKGKVWNTY